MKLSYNGKTMTLCELSFQADIPYSTLSWRIRNGWTLGEAISGKRIHPTIAEYMNASDAEYIAHMRYTTAEVFQLYAEWCDKNCMNPITDIKSFSKQMKNWGWEIRSSNGKRIFALP